MPLQNEKTNALTVDSLMDDACRTVRLNDWGEQDFRTPLERLIAFFKDRYHHEERMDILFRNGIKSLLVNRLFIRDNLKSYPQIMGTPIKRPLFIVGLARTGSTLLHRLLAQDPTCRVLLYWEMNCPFYGARLGLNHEELSIKVVDLKTKEIYSQYPALYHIHEIKTKEPEECNVIMRHTFCSLSIASEWHLPGYAQWLVAHDMTESYRCYRKLLQLLLWHKTGNFLALKCPSHLINLRVILNVFPDANIVWLHRSPVKSMASYLNLLSVFWGNKAGYKDFIEFIYDYSVKSVEMGMAVQDEINPARFLNVSYKQLVDNPVKAILDIYNYFDYHVNTHIEENIRAWLKENPQHKHGVHKYNLEKFGLTDSEVGNRFSQYIEKYKDLL